MSSVTPIAPTPVAPVVTRPSGRRRLHKAGWNLLALLVLVVIVFPVYWMVDYEFGVANWTLTELHVGNFVRHDWFANPWTGFGVFTLLIVWGAKMVPLAALIIPLYIMMSRFNDVRGVNHVLGVDKLGGVIVMYLTFVLPFTVWTLRGFLLGVPKELEESAMVDGTTRFGAFVRILLPLVGPGLVATSIFAFIQAWNEFLIAYVFLHTPEKQTLMVWLAGFTTLRGTEWGPLMAGATLCSLPVIVFFLLVQRRIAFGLTAGAVKG